MRLDVYLSQGGLVRSRTKARALIEDGCVSVDGACVTKPAYDIDEGCRVEVRDETKYVGRGGIKLEHALEEFDLSVRSLVCADIGASTGGFTDCLLQYGAAHVYAVDSGHSQLDEKLRHDPRVTNIEGFNAKFLEPGTIGEQVDLAVCDLSFISQTLVVPAIKKILNDDGRLLSLVKPQFECGREAIGKNGIVKDKKYRLYALRRVTACMRECGLCPIKLTRSPITGGDGNVEFLLLAENGGDDKSTLGETDFLEAIR